MFDQPDYIKFIVDDNEFEDITDELNIKVKK